MAAGTIIEIRDALAKALELIENLRAVSGIPGQINPVVAAVFRKLSTYDDVQHSGGDDVAMTYTFGVRVFAPRASDRTSQDLLEGFAEPTGPTSIKAAIETDDGVLDYCDWALVTTVDEIQITTVSDAPVTYLTEDFTIEVGIS